MHIDNGRRGCGTSSGRHNTPINTQLAVGRGLSSQVVPYLLDYGQFRQHIQLHLSAMHRWDTCYLLPTLYLLQRNHTYLYNQLSYIEGELNGLRRRLPGFPQEAARAHVPPPQAPAEAAAQSQRPGRGRSPALGEAELASMIRGAQALAVQARSRSPGDPGSAVFYPAGTSPPQPPLQAFQRYEELERPHAPPCPALQHWTLRPGS